MLPIPIPQRGGSLEELLQFVNVASPGDFILLIAWLVSALRPAGLEIGQARRHLQLVHR